MQKETAINIGIVSFIPPKPGLVEPEPEAQTSSRGYVDVAIKESIYNDVFLIAGNIIRYAEDMTFHETCHTAGMSEFFVRAATYATGYDSETTVPVGKYLYMNKDNGMPQYFKDTYFPNGTFDESKRESFFKDLKVLGTIITTNPALNSMYLDTEKLDKFMDYFVKVGRKLNPDNIINQSKNEEKK